MIIRRTGSERVARLLTRKSEDPDDSALEFLDQRMEIGAYNPEISYEIEDETIEKSFTKSKSKGIIKYTEETEKENTINEHVKGNGSWLERD